MFMKSNFTGLITAAVLLALGAAATAAFVFRSDSSASLTAEQRYQQTLSELKAGNAEGVGEAIRVLGQTSGFEQHATLLEAVLLLRGNRVESALSTLAGLDQEGPLRHEILLAAGEALNRLQRYGEAELALTVVAREQPDNVDGHRWLGATYYDLGAFDGAIVELNHVVRLAPTITGRITCWESCTLTSNSMEMPFANLRKRSVWVRFRKSLRKSELTSLRLMWPCTNMTRPWSNFVR